MHIVCTDIHDKRAIYVAKYKWMLCIMAMNVICYSNSSKAKSEWENFP